MSQPLVGAPRNRVDGPAKVTGSALYTHDVALANMLHAAVVTSTIANGHIRSIDDSQARRVEGVVEIMTHLNAPAVNAQKSNPFESVLFLLQDDAVQRIAANAVRIRASADGNVVVQCGTIEQGTGSPTVFSQLAAEFLRTARIMNANPNIETIIVAADDPYVNPAHVRGIGEVAMSGSAAAIANAVCHATGIRVRDLPITPEKLLGLA